MYKRQGLTHPNIVNVFDVGDDEGVYYIVMELIEGITLKEYICLLYTSACPNKGQAGGIYRNQFRLQKS